MPVTVGSPPGWANRTREGSGSWGERPAGTPAQLGRAGFLAQDAPVYAGLSVAGHLRMGAWLNHGWDTEFAKRRISDLGLNLRPRRGGMPPDYGPWQTVYGAAEDRPGLLSALARITDSRHRRAATSHHKQCLLSKEP